MSNQTEKNITAVVLDVLMGTGRLELFGDDEFVEDCVHYLRQNKD